MVKRFMAPGPWITRDLKECVRASDYDALAAERDALAQLVCDLWHSSAAAHIPPGLQKRVRDAISAQLAEAQRFPHGAARP